jgi:protein-arginine kinase activator protein McsA
MPECQNCGAHVTADYVRVNSRRGESQVYICPFCPDKIRGSDHTGRERRSNQTKR